MTVEYMGLKNNKSYVKRLDIPATPLLNSLAFVLDFFLEIDFL